MESSFYNKDYGKYFNILMNDNQSCSAIWKWEM